VARYAGEEGKRGDSGTVVATTGDGLGFRNVFVVGKGTGGLTLGAMCQEGENKRGFLWNQGVPPGVGRTSRGRRRKSFEGCPEGTRTWSERGWRRRGVGLYFMTVSPENMLRTKGWGKLRGAGCNAGLAHLGLSYQARKREEGTGLSGGLKFSVRSF